MFHWEELKKKLYKFQSKIIIIIILLKKKNKTDYEAKLLRETIELMTSYYSSDSFS